MSAGTAPDRSGRPQALPAISVNGIPLTNYRRTDLRLVQIAYDEEVALVRVDGRDPLVRYQETELGIVNAGGPLVLTINDEDIVLASRSEARPDGRLPGLFCSYESGG